VRCKSSLGLLTLTSRSYANEGVHIGRLFSLLIELLIEKALHQQPHKSPEISRIR